MTFNIYASSRVVFAAFFFLMKTKKGKKGKGARHKSASKQLFLFAIVDSLDFIYCVHWFIRVRNNYDKTILCLRHRSGKLINNKYFSINLFRLRSLLLYLYFSFPASPTHAQPKSDYPHISSSYELCFPKKKRIFIRFLLFCSFLIKDPSDDSITCFHVGAVSVETLRFRLRDIQIEFQMRIDGVIAFTLRPHGSRKRKVSQVFSSVRYFYPGCNENYTGDRSIAERDEIKRDGVRGEVMNISSCLHLKAFTIRN